MVILYAEAFITTMLDHWFITYLVIGYLVSLYMIWFYRHREKTKSTPNQTDAIGALIGPFVWPLQILKHLFRKR